MKLLEGAELADFIKERQAREVRALRSQGTTPTLLIIRDSDNPVITKYVNLKAQYGSDIGVKVIDKKVKSAAEAQSAIKSANADEAIHGIIVQLPLTEPDKTDDVVKLIAPEKDVDGLSSSVAAPEGPEESDDSSQSALRAPFDSATATAINWLLAGHNIDLNNKKIAIVGRGRLVGRPLIKMWRASGYNLTVFGHDGDLTKLKNYDLIVTATGVPHLIQPEMVQPGAVIIDAGTASEDGVLVGDVDDAVREQALPAAITPKIGGVGPLTVAVLFEDVIIASKKRESSNKISV